MIININSKTLNKWLKNDEAILIDVREIAEYQAEHIKGARNIPLSKISVEKLSDHADKKLVFQCHLGGRSMQACNKIISLACDIYNLEGGISAWIATDLPTEKSN